MNGDICKICKSEILFKIIKKWRICNNCFFIFELNPNNNILDLKNNLEYRNHSDHLKTNSNILKKKKEEVLSSFFYFKNYQNIFEKNLKILDFGSNHGYLCDALKNTRNEVIGIEISDKFRDFSNKNNRPTYENIHEVIDNYGKNYFDIIFLRNCFHFIEDIKDIFQNFNKILKHDGVILMYEPSIDFSKDFFDCLYTKVEYPHHKHWLSYFSINSIFSQLNYKVKISFFRPKKTIFILKKEENINKKIDFVSRIYIYSWLLLSKTIIIINDLFSRRSS